jgi:rubrerythrin
MTFTVRETIETAIAAERASEALYRGLQARFAPYKGIADFFEAYALEESKHVQWLESLRSRLDDQTLNQIVDASIEYSLQNVSAFSVEKALTRVSNLEDAFQLVNEIESAETNAIFQFLLDHFEPDESVKAFLRQQLEKHVDKLRWGLPAEYQGTVARQALRALKL